MHGAAEAVWQQVARQLPGFSVEVLASVDSTNTELMRRARAGQHDPVLLVALEQTAGRGRMGRAWHSSPGDSLTFSLGLPLEPGDWSGLSLAIGLAAAQALHPAIRIKWPNDLWADGRKLAGILVETASIAGSRARYVVAGIGINIAPRPADPSFTIQPVGLRELDPALDAGRALRLVAPRVIAAMQAFERHGFGPLQAAYAERDALAGRSVRLSDGTAGEARGVDGTGALLVHTAAGLKAVTSSEVSVRPA
jgi:BirA family biotin operon repressor/biotin-[acetyl-CoA-carboxylase] ligase